MADNDGGGDLAEYGTFNEIISIFCLKAVTHPVGDVQFVLHILKKQNKTRLCLDCVFLHLQPSQTKPETNIQRFPIRLITAESVKNPWGEIQFRIWDSKTPKSEQAHYFPLYFELFQLKKNVVLPLRKLNFAFKHKKFQSSEHQKASSSVSPRKYSFFFYPKSISCWFSNDGRESWKDLGKNEKGPL